MQKLGYEDDPAKGKLLLHTQGDLNGDGFSDLLTYGSDSYCLFYRKPEGLRGTLNSNQGDAELDLATQENLFVLGDLDGDGQTSSSLRRTMSSGSSTEHPLATPAAPSCNRV